MTSNKQYLFNEAGDLVVPMLYTLGYEAVTLREPKARDIKTMRRHAIAYTKQNAGAPIDDITTLEIAITVLCTSHELTVKQIDEWDAEDMMEVGSALSTFRVFKNYINA